MSRKRRIIRKVHPDTQPWFGEQMWPLVVAMFVLGGFLAGTVLAYLRLDSPLWYANAWTWLIAIPLVIGGGLVALAYTGNRLLRRTMQLAMVTCAIFHLVLFIVAIETDVFRRVWMEVIANTEQIPEKEIVKVPVYSALQHNPKEYAASEFEQPIETEPPDPVPNKIEPQQLDHQTDAVKPQPVTEPDVSVQPNLVRRREPSKVTPRQDPEASRLSRRSGAKPQIPNQQVQPPDLNVQQPREPRIESSDVAIDRQSQPSANPPRQPSQQLPEVSREPRPTELARKTAERAPTPESPSATSYTRRISDPSILPRLDVRSDSPPAVARRTDIATIEPKNTFAKKRETRAPQAEPMASQSVPELAPRLEPRRQPQHQPSPDRPTLAHAPKSISRRQPRMTPRPTDSVTAVETPTQPNEQPRRTAVVASPTPVARHATASTPPRTSTTTAQPTQPVESIVPTTAAVSRAEHQTDPNLPNIADTESSRSPRHIVPTVEPSTTVASVAESGQPMRRANELPAAAQLALSKSTSGIAGRGRQSNLDKSSTAPEQPAHIASGSAKRARTTQQLPAGPALSPHDAALVRTDRAGQSRPSATLKATRAELAMAPGGKKPADLQASASASLTRSASNAKSGPVTATKGSIDFDFGPTTTVSGTGQERAAGGGQPKLSSGGIQEFARKQRSGTALAPSSLADSQAAQANTASSTQSSGDSGPQSPAPMAVSGPISRSATEAPASSRAAAIAGTASPAVDDGPSVAPLLNSRAEAAESATGPSEIGGGTNLPRKMARGPRLLATTQADSVELAGAQTSSGRPAAEPSNAGGLAPSRRAGGVAAPAETGPVGAIVSDVLAELPTGTQPGLGNLSRDTSPAVETGPAIRDLSQTGGPGRRQHDLQIPSIAEQIGVPNASPGTGSTASPTESSAHSIGQPDTGPTRRPASNPLPVDIAAAPGPGGLGVEISQSVGLARRRIQDEGPHMQLDTLRFARKDFGGLPDLSDSVATPAEPYRRRAERSTGTGRSDNSPGPQTEEAIELGLVFLGRCQADDGAWRLDHFAHIDGLPQMASDTAATGLALLAYQGAGYHHRSQRYGEVVARGIDYLVKNQQANGCLFQSMDPVSNRVVQFYSHGIAALALSEAYGMTQDPKLRQPAQKALDYIVQTQHPDRGGWRYTPQIGSDTSVTGWMVMALKSGELAELKVPAKTYEGIRKWLDRARASESEPYRFSYNPYAPNTATQRAGRRPTTTMTSVGLLMQLYLGWRRDQPLMSQGADVLLQSLPAVGTPTNPKRDTYYWYYATQVMFHMGGRYWNAWNERLHPLLINTQVREGEMAGSWDPQLPVRDRWAPHAGRIYVTAMNMLSLEVTYRYLPLYEDTAQ